jgi:hypothetical protein
VSKLRGIGLLVAATCAVPAAATASTLEDATLKGAIEKSGRAEVAVSSGKIQGTSVNRYRWEFRRISVRCSGRSEVAKHPVEGGFDANAEFDHVGEPWGISGTAEVGPGGDYRTKVSGRLISRRKARGWVRVYGTNVAIRGGGHESCDSGRLHWIARARE